MPKNICVFASSSSAVDSVYVEAANDLGRMLAQRGDTLIFGGAQVGLMGALAKSAHGGGKVIAVIPEFIHAKGMTFDKADEVIIAKDLRERKAVMESKADAFIALPGGFGTLEEILEIITLKQLQRHQKAIVFFNVNRFYDPLIRFFDNFMNQKFAKKSSSRAYFITSDYTELFDHIDSYQQEVIPKKWF